MVRILNGFDDLRGEVIISHGAHLGLVPVRAFTLWANTRLSVEVSRHPLMAAAFAAVAHHGNRDLCHGSYITRDSLIRQSYLNG